MPIHIIHDDDVSTEEAHMALTVSAQANAVRRPGPTVNVLGDLSNLNNYLPDSGAMLHMTPCFQDL